MQYSNIDGQQPSSKLVCWRFRFIWCRMGAIKLLVALIILAVAPACAQTVALSGGRNVPGNMVLGLTDPSISFPFLNYIKGLISFQSTAGDNFPSKLNSDNYVTSAPAHNVFGTVTLPPSYTGQFVYKHTGNADVQLARGAPGFTVVSDPGSCVTGVTTSNLTISSACTNPRVVFTFTTTTPTTVTYNMLAAGTFTNFSGAILCRSADEAAIDAGSIFNADFLAQLASVNPRVIRTLTWNNVNNNNNLAKQSYRSPLTALTWNSVRWEPNAWAGTTSGTDTYTVSQPPTAITLVQGDTVQVQFSNANTITTPTLNVGGTGAKTIVLPTAGALSVGSISANSNATLVYDSVLDKWIWINDGLKAFVPIEVLVSLANQMKVGLWFNFPHLSDDASITTIGSYVAANLSTSLSFYPEFSNEVWNFGGGFPQTSWMQARGVVLEFCSDNNRRFYSPYSLRVIQMMNLLEAAWSPRATSSLLGVMAFQAFGPTAGTQTYRFNSSDLTLDSNGHETQAAGCAGSGNPIVTNYTAFPNRAIDRTKIMAYAHYYSGAQLTNFDANYVTNCAAGNCVELLAAADNYALGTAIAINRALNFVDTDVRSGTLHDGTAGSQTLLALNTNIYPAWETVAASYDGARPTGFSNLKVRAYEGGYEGWYPVAGTCTTLSWSAGYCTSTGTIANLLNAYKADDRFRRLVNDQLRQFVGQSHSDAPSQLLLSGVNQWSVQPGDLYFSPKWKSWDALLNFDTGGTGP